MATEVTREKSWAKFVGRLDRREGFFMSGQVLELGPGRFGVSIPGGVQGMTLSDQVRPWSFFPTSRVLGFWDFMILWSFSFVPNQDLHPKFQPCASAPPGWFSANYSKWRAIFNWELIKVKQLKPKLQIPNCLRCQLLNNWDEFCAEHRHSLKEERDDITLLKIFNRNNLIKTNYIHLQNSNTEMLCPFFFSFLHWVGGKKNNKWRVIPIYWLAGSSQAVHAHLLFLMGRERTTVLSFPLVLWLLSIELPWNFWS